MNLRVSLIASTLLALAASTASADQCAWVDQDQALSAQKLIGKGADVIEFCEQCRGGVRKTLPPVQKTEVKKTSDQALFELIIDGKPYDLAYTFVKTSRWTYTNLALMVGCKTTGVSPALDLKSPARPAPPHRPVTIHRGPPPSSVPPAKAPAKAPLGSRENPDMLLE